MNEFEQHKLKKLSRIAKDMGETTSLSGHNMANLLYDYTYGILEADSMIKASQKEIDLYSK